MQYNFILETGSPGGLWVSTGSNALEKVYDGSLNGNGGTDWHIGTSVFSTFLLFLFLSFVPPSEGRHVSSRPGGPDLSSGALRLPLNGNTQQISETDFYYSGIYVEDSGPTTQP